MPISGQGLKSEKSIGYVMCMDYIAALNLQ